MNKTKQTLNWGDKKFLINQNLTVDFVFFMTETIIILKNLSYKWPEATENTLISACGLVLVDSPVTLKNEIIWS